MASARRSSGVYDRRHAAVVDIPPIPVPIPTPTPAPAPVLALWSNDLVAIPTPDFNTQIPKGSPQWQPIPDGSGWWEGYNTGALSAALGVLTAVLAPPLAAGNAPGNIYREHQPLKKKYTAFKYQWSPGFEINSAGMQKTHYDFPQSAGDLAFEIQRLSNGLYIFDCVTQVAGDARRLSSGRVVPTFDPSVEHQLETLIDYNSRRIALAVDGVITIDVRDVAFPADAGITESQVYPGWGGSGPSKTRTDWAKYSKLIVAGI